MQTTTLLKLRKAGACTSALDKIRQHLGKDYNGDVTIQDAINAGCTLSEIIWALRTLEEGKEITAAFAILSAKRVVKDRAWNIWADTWLDGTDRSKVVALAAANAATDAAATTATHAANATAYAAAYATAYAAAYATHAANATAYAAAYAANAANAAANAAAHAAYAANAAANAAHAAAANDDAHAAANAAAHAANAAAYAANANAAAYAANAAEKQYQLQLLVELCSKD